MGETLIYSAFKGVSTPKLRGYARIDLPHPTQSFDKPRFRVNTRLRAKLESKWLELLIYISSSHYARSNFLDLLI